MFVTVSLSEQKLLKPFPLMQMFSLLLLHVLHVQLSIIVIIIIIKLMMPLS